MQKRSLYAVFLAAVVGIAGAILAVSRRRTAPVAEITVQTSAMPPAIVQATTIAAPQKQSPVRSASQPSIVVLVASWLGMGCLITAQILLLRSRNPILPLILFVAGILTLQPLLASQEHRQKIVFMENQSRTPLIILAMAVIALLLNIFAPPPLNSGQFQIWSTLVAVLVVPVVYLIGAAYASPPVGMIAAGFAAVSGWTLALGKAEPEYISLAIISAVSLVALEYIRRRQGNIIYAIWLVFFLGVIIIVTRSLASSAPLGRSNYAEIPANPQLSASEGLFTSLLMFNLTSDPNPLHGIVDRPIFSPMLSALFVIGLLTLAWRIDAHRRWGDIFLLLALVMTLLPSAFQTDLPVRYPDLQRGAMALPITMLIAALGAWSLAQGLINRLDRIGIVIAIGLFVVALAVIALDANQHYINVFLPVYERSVSISHTANLTFR